MTNKREFPYNTLPMLPPAVDLDTKEILRKTISANKALAELKGWAFSQSNPLLLLQSITLQEAKSSSEIENVVTTNDELYQAFATPSDKNIPPAAKEVLHYKEALWYGYQEIINGSPLTINKFVELFRIIKRRSDGIRNLPGTVLRNTYNEIVYTPPDNSDDIMRLMTNLEQYINIDFLDDRDPLIKLAIIHYQFECIHPFPDGNGRVGRIINVLYLVYQKLLDFPILYLSRYITQHKKEYYHALMGVTESSAWDSWIMYILDAIEVTARETLISTQNIYTAQENLFLLLKEKAPDLCSKEFVELLFEQPYCKISFLVDRGIAKPQTASKYLKRLCDLNILQLIKRGRENYYINKVLWDILTR